jgi:hypothetical protein
MRWRIACAAASAGGDAIAPAESKKAGASAKRRAVENRRIREDWERAGESGKHRVCVRRGQLGV